MVGLDGGVRLFFCLLHLWKERTGLLIIFRRNAHLFCKVNRGPMKSKMAWRGTSLHKKIASCRFEQLLVGCEAVPSCSGPLRDLTSRTRPQLTLGTFFPAVTSSIGARSREFPGQLTYESTEILPIANAIIAQAFKCCVCRASSSSRQRCSPPRLDCVFDARRPQRSTLPSQRAPSRHFLYASYSFSFFCYGFCLPRRPCCFSAPPPSPRSRHCGPSSCRPSSPSIAPPPARLSPSSRRRRPLRY